MILFRKIINWVSSLKVAIFLLLIIAITSAIGTAIPQGEPIENYLEQYQDRPWLGLINGSNIIRLQLNHVYSSYWFIGLLSWLGIALILCSWRRQWPILQAALRWVDYKSPSELNKLAIAETRTISSQTNNLEVLAIHLEKKGWQIKRNKGRLAARKWVIGRVGPPLIHLGLVLIMFGATWGNLNGQKIERFLSPGGSFNLINNEGVNQLTLALKDFKIDRDPSGRTEQFRSKLELIEPGNVSGAIKEISVNHPLRYNGMTIYQADWSLASIILQLGDSPKFQLPLTSFPALGDEVWGIVLPTNKNGGDPVLLSLSSDRGPVSIFDENGTLLGMINPGDSYKEIRGIKLSVKNVVSSSGLLLKRDPGVPLVYGGFALTLIGGSLSILATRQLWAINDVDNCLIHVGGLCNRNMSGFSRELPTLIEVISHH